MPSNSAVELQANYTFINTILDFGVLAVSFVVFYFLANKNKINAEKSIILALLLGFIIGSASPYLFSIVSWKTTDLLLYSSLLVGSLISAVSQYFFPALSALLLAKFREKKSNQNLIENTTYPMPKVINS